MLSEINRIKIRWLPLTLILVVGFITLLIVSKTLGAYGYGIWTQLAF